MYSDYTVTGLHGDWRVTVTVANCQQYDDRAANDSVVTMLLIGTNSDYTVTVRSVQSLWCSYRAKK